MTVDEYQVLTGQNVRNRAAVTAQLERTQTILETMLGFPLDPEQVTKNLYNEAGKTPTQGWPSTSIDRSTLLPADPVVGAYRLFRFDQRDAFYHLDPFTTIHAVKLVHNDVTVYTFSPDDYRLQVGREGWAKYLEPQLFRVTNLRYALALEQSLTFGLTYQLAVDADWLWDELPKDLQHVLAEMASYRADPKRYLKSESIGGHSYSVNRPTPEALPENLDVISRYAGPWGTLTRTNTL